MAVSSVYIWYTPLSFLGSCGPQRGAKGHNRCTTCAEEEVGRIGAAAVAGAAGGRPPVREAAGGRALAAEAEAEARLRARKCLTVSY